MAKQIELLSATYTEQKKVATVARSAGDMVIGTNVNGFVGFQDVAIGDTYALITEAEKAGGPKAAVAVDTDEPAYWDDTAKLITNVAAANTLIGVFQEANAIGDADCTIIFDGTAAFLKA